jgi:hypothetical protein
MRVVDGVQRVQRSLTLNISTEAEITRVTILHDGRLRLARALFGLRS